MYTLFSIMHIVCSCVWYVNNAYYADADFVAVSVQALPAYIEKVNWCSLSEGLEVYSLLNQVAETIGKQDFPVEVRTLTIRCKYFQILWRRDGLRTYHLLCCGNGSHSPLFSYSLYVSVTASCLGRLSAHPIALNCIVYLSVYLVVFFCCCVCACVCV